MPILHLHFHCAEFQMPQCCIIFFRRDPSEEGQPQARYKELAEKGKANFPGNSVTDLYQDSKKNAEATAESAKTKAAENRNPIS